MAVEEKPSPSSRRSPSQLEREETKLWRLALWFVVLLAAGLAALMWERLQNVPYHLGALAPGLLVLAVLFAAYAYGRQREVSDLKVLLKDLLVQFLTQDSRFFREQKTELDRLAAHLDHRQLYVIINDNRFADFARQIQHVSWSLPGTVVAIQLPLVE